MLTRRSALTWLGALAAAIGLKPAPVKAVPSPYGDTYRSGDTISFDATDDGQIIWRKNDGPWQYEKWAYEVDVSSAGAGTTRIAKQPRYEAPPGYTHWR